MRAVGSDANGVFCSVFTTSGMDGTAIALNDSSSYSLDAAYSNQTGVLYTAALERTGTSYTCNIVSSVGTSMLTRTFTATQNPFEAGIRINGGKATYRWLMIVTSP